LEFDPLYLPYPSKRMLVYAKNGMVAASQPLAAQAGLDILKKGGNAIDAAIATAACLTVVEPTSNGIGGDAYALIWYKGELYGLNASGFAPRKSSIDSIKKAGHQQMPSTGWLSVTVPGAPGGWAALSQRFGRLSLSEVFQPAIEYGENGFPISPDLWSRWKLKYDVFLKELKGDEFKHWFQTFAPKGRPPHIGEIWKAPDHARTLRLLAETNGESFYRGEIAERIDDFSKKYNGHLTKEDLAEYSPEWVKPISVNYRGYNIWELPPNGQGLVALMALNILKEFEFHTKESLDTVHKQIEAIKLAFADGYASITDPKEMKIRVDDLLSSEYAKERKKLIGDLALQPAPGELSKGGTVYFATADGEGNMVSFIQSNANGFGSGLVIPNTGISLQNRGAAFTLDRTHINCLEPGKRTFHTIIPGFITKGHQPIGPFGIMGGAMQPQAHVQVLMNMLDFQLNPQAALDAPRWHWMKDKIVSVEQSFPEHLAMALVRKGHEVRWTADKRIYGKGQIIIRNAEGVLVGGTEPRTDGMIAAW
jgi:gamma-glutamyltranspeptidase / glutathione hydrolase